MLTSSQPTITFMVFAYIRISRATDSLGLPAIHPLYHRHASLVLRNNVTESWYAYGFGFSGFSAEPIPRKEKVFARELIVKKMPTTKVDKLFDTLNQSKAADYDIAKYNCVDHLIEGLKVVGKQSRLLNHYQYMNKGWYKHSMLRRKVL
ncbi:hypothetical protein [Pseudoalteromonas luteoviolacea]|uniref:DUF4105 domain-containing protein n=1 Tax=Pseudoalteromonas luteoviolacea DSM 6061 TaxID=1365250 RepID=A0A166W4R6_9GAMM|nr:hypothetical protein [Pseudoalteromonas luteoviolacea]KZN35409.1 hypothetical protein N475_18880 [Pseudoalteromonas luteoviolacea DSM 6061]KZN53531.1 hypothetical protein N474_20955 [Pseudoalteromonas luteoviolacea CPMOR-2]MBE0387656.1 hypothetical protein [Pseudoalteromonas luteoviolacea DSM 6061]TQF72437.1 hypothetical protein FLM44_15890 [Pseudoalteromonas luteoviolacea]